MALGRRVLVPMTIGALAATALVVGSPRLVPIAAHGALGAATARAQAKPPPLDLGRILVSLADAGQSSGEFSFGTPLPASERLGAKFPSTAAGMFVPGGDRCARTIGRAYLGQWVIDVFFSGTSSTAASVLVSQLDPSVQQSAGFQATWAKCLAADSDRHLQPVAFTLRGTPAFSVRLDRASNPSGPPGDAVYWQENGVEIAVGSDFGDQPKDPRLAAIGRPAADPVEPVLDVASVLIGRHHDETQVLLDEAFTPVPGFSYGPPTPGYEPAVRTQLRQALSQSTRAVRRAQERPAAAGQTVSFVDVVVWDPDVMRAPGFRENWLAGIVAGADRGTSPRDVALGPVTGVEATEHGITAVHYLGECYEVKVAGPSAAAVESLARQAVAAQVARHQAVFGTAPAPGARAGQVGTPSAPCSRVNLATVGTANAGGPLPRTVATATANR